MKMKKKITITGEALILPGNDVDTDRIIPARYMKCVTFDGLGVHVFEDDRAQASGQHPFDLPENQGCSILVVGANFGSGSSREHAVHALTGWGIKVIVGLSFADIFRGNATANGLVCVDVEPAVHVQLITILAGDDKSEITVDLFNQSIAAVHSEGLLNAHCAIPEADRQMLLLGTWDKTAMLLEAGEEIEATAKRLPYLMGGGMS